MVNNLANPQPLTTAQKFYQLSVDYFTYLYSRWQDEKDYEDPAEYLESMKKRGLEHGVVVTKFTKRPFGCEFECDGKKYKLTIGSRQYAYKQIG